MFGYHYYHSPFPFCHVHLTPQNEFRFAYPGVDTKIFIQSVKAFSPLMQQGSVLLRYLGNPSFAHRIMDAAQHGNKAQVDAMVKTIGLNVPITTHFSPTGIVFTLHSREKQDPLENCCSLSIAIRWGH